MNCCSSSPRHKYLEPREWHRLEGELYGAQESQHQMMAHVLFTCLGGDKSSNYPSNRLMILSLYNIVSLTGDEGAKDDY